MRKPRDGDGISPTSERRRAALSHPRRLSALRCLAKADDGLHLADLARDVARREEAERTVRNPRDDAAERIYVDLYHVHLPKLEEARVVWFDPESRVVSASVDAASLHDWEATDDHRAVPDAGPETAE